MPVNAKSDNRSVGCFGFAMCNSSLGEAESAPDVVESHGEVGALSATAVGCTHGLGLSWDRVVKGLSSSGACVATVESPERTYWLNSA